MKKIVLGLILAFFILSILFTKNFNLFDIESIKIQIGSYGILSPIIFIILMALAIVISPIPSMPLDAVAGVLFGPVLGTAYAVIGGTIGASISFLIARFLGRKFIERIIKRHIDFCDACTDRYIVYFIFFSRLFPIFQFDIISYGAGITSIPLKKFVVATFFGMIPVTFLFVSYGDVIFFGDLFSVAFSTLLIVAIFVVPVLIKKYNIFGLKDKIKPQ